MFFSNNFEIRTCVATSFQQYTKKKWKTQILHLIYLAKNIHLKGFTFLFDLSITDSACYLRNTPTTVQPLTRYSIYRKIWFVWFLWDFEIYFT